MAAKMAAGANRKITFEPVGLESPLIPLFLGKFVMSNPFLGVYLQFEVNIKVKGHVQGHVSEIMQRKTVVLHVINIFMQY